LRDEVVAVSENYDHVILDLGAGVDQAVTTLATHAGRVLVVITEEPTALTDAYAFVKLMVMRNPRADIRVAVNMASGRKQGERTFGALSRACQSFLKFTPRLAGVIRRDLKVPDAIRHQSPLLSRHPLTAAATDVEELARALAR
jgi:flagellar biosynthesis protein FlhG